MSADGSNNYLATVGRCLAWAIPTSAIMAFLAMAMTWLFCPSLYESTAWIEIRSNQDYIVFRPETGGRESAQAFTQTQLSLLRNPLVLNRVLQLPQVARMETLAGKADPVVWIQRNLAIRAGAGDLHSVSLTSPNRQEVAPLLNAIVDEYYKHFESENATRVNGLSNMLQRELRLKRQVIQQLQDEIRSRTAAINANGLIVDGDGNVDEQATGLRERSAEMVDIGFVRQQLVLEIGLLEQMHTRAAVLQTELNAPPRVVIRMHGEEPKRPKNTKEKTVLTGMVGFVAFIVPLFLALVVVSLAEINKKQKRPKPEHEA